MGYAEFERLANDRVEDMLDAYAQVAPRSDGPRRWRASGQT